MCSIFGPIMENYQGDLTDILRASSGGGAYGSSTTSTTSSSSEPAASSHNHHHHQNQYHQYHWQQQQHHFSSDPMSFSSVLEDPRGSNSSFGDPFSTMRDPFLHELDIPPYFNTSTTTAITSSSAEIMSGSSSRGGLEEAAASFGAGVTGGGGNTNNNTTAPSVFAQHKVLEDDMRSIRPCKNIFSNMIQISPSSAKLPLSPYDSPAVAASPRAIKPSAVVSPNMVNANPSKDCLVDNTAVQISSPRNPGLKRRKNQAKKVVCIPAPAAANSRQTGEVVPSDLWAWRKYGQKPIKGSPYPRGYYRCSSSKGCSARKQVERSRTDPNMLVITYTSEHNHPWPTQRNALAGSTRSQPSKSNAASKNNSETSQSQKGGSGTTNNNKPKEEHHQQQQEKSNNSEGGNVSPVVAGNSSANSASVKEEMEDIEKQLEMDDGEFSDGLSYKPSMMEDFFAELGEIEADPLNVLFSQGFNAGGDDQRESKALDPFNLFDWSGDTNSNSFEEPNKRRL